MEKLHHAISTSQELLQLALNCYTFGSSVGKCDAVQFIVVKWLIYF